MCSLITRVYLLCSLDDAAAARVAAAAASPVSSTRGEVTRRGAEVRSFRRTYVFPLPHPTQAAATPAAGSLPVFVIRAAQQLSSGDRVYLGAGVLLASVATTVLVALRRAVADEAQRGALPGDSGLASRRAALRTAAASGGGSSLSRDERLKRMGLHLPGDMRSAAAARSGVLPGAPAQAALGAASLTPAERALAAAQVSAAKRRADADAALARAEAAAAAELRKRQLAELAAAEAAAEAAAKQVREQPATICAEPRPRACIMPDCDFPFLRRLSWRPPRCWSQLRCRCSQRQTANPHQLTTQLCRRPSRGCGSGRRAESRRGASMLRAHFGPDGSP